MADADNNKLVRGISDVQGGKLVQLGGEIDMRQAPALREALTQVIAARPRKLVLGMTEVTYIDSTGLGTLVYFLRQVNTYKGKMALFGLSPMVRGVFEITKLLNVFTICDTLEDAVKA